MPIYQYKGLIAGAGNTSGMLDAGSPREAREKLRAQKIYVTAIAETNSSGASKKNTPGWRQALRRKRISASDLSMTTRQLATLLQSGVPLADALAALVEQVEDARFEAVMRDLRERVTQGAGFADALEQHPGYFSDLYVNMVRAGETSGNLDEILHQVAAYLIKEARLRNKVGTAMTYPAIMMVVGVVVVIVLMKFAVPKILEVLDSVNAEALPIPTRILMTVSDIVENYWPLLLLGCIASVFSYKFFVWTERGRFAMDGLMLKLPIVGLLFRKQAVSRFAVTFSTLLRTGIPVLEGLQVVQKIVGNTVIAKTLGEVREAIMQGADISSPLKKSGVFPPVVGYMIAIGEESGRLDEILTSLAETYDEEVDVATQRMTAMLEPLIIVCLAVVVAFIALAIILPVMELSTSVK
jgi:general secretion pathway protein F